MFLTHGRPHTHTHTHTLCTSTTQWHVRISSYCYCHTHIVHIRYTLHTYTSHVQTTYIHGFWLVFFLLSFTLHAFQCLKSAALSGVTISFSLPLYVSNFPLRLFSSRFYYYALFPLFSHFVFVSAPASLLHRYFPYAFLCNLTTSSHLLRYFAPNTFFLSLSSATIRQKMHSFCRYVANSGNSTIL